MWLRAKRVCIFTLSGWSKPFPPLLKTEITPLNTLMINLRKTTNVYLQVTTVTVKNKIESNLEVVT